VHIREKWGDIKKFKEERNVLQQIKRRKVNWIVHIQARTSTINTIGAATFGAGACLYVRLYTYIMLYYIHILCIYIYIYIYIYSYMFVFLALQPSVVVFFTVP